jgi:hypothetical protein
MYKNCISHLRKKKKEKDFQNEITPVESQTDLEKVSNFMIDLSRQLYRNKKYMELENTSPFVIDLKKLCTMHGVPESIIYLLSKPNSSFGWLKIVNEYYVWDHRSPTKADIERVYRAVCYYENKKKGELSEGIFDQPCKFGCRILDIVLCTNNEWEFAPKKCHRTYHTQGVVRDEDCEGFKE